ncbi:unnamed protein product [Ostreobium quekettii]|uniref:Uncharacterized protein n=1 Tax=Ostreobium quekettii TaxID=121088 RepID=A0A8S1J9X1_9CHLO|nr:unnamed protein product [Ostreobium quekettii]
MHTVTHWGLVLVVWCADDKGRGWDLPVQDSLHLVRKAKDQVLFLRQLGDELLEATTSYEDAAAAASIIASARTEADTTLTSLHINFGSLSGVLPSRNQPSTGRGSMRSKQSVKESRGVMERYSAAKRHCGMALEAWRKEAQGRGELGCGGGSLDGALYCPRLVKEGWTSMPDSCLMGLICLTTFWCCYFFCVCT